MKKLEDNLYSNWIKTQIELMKVIHGYEFKDTNNEVGSIDYVLKEKGEGVKLLMIISDKKSGKSKATHKKTKKTIESLENEGYSEILIVAEEFTRGAIKLIEEREDMDYLSPDVWQPHSLPEMVQAIQKKTEELCKLICGKVPTTEEECKGYHKDGIVSRYTCEVRLVSDKSDFHAKMGWTPLLIDDFKKLIDIQESLC